MNVSQDEIEDEEEIIWLVEPTSMAYVREGTIVTDKRRKPITGQGSTNTIVGYAVLKADAPGRCGLFRRRIFWLSKYDRYYQPEGTYSYGTPAEAVDPRTVSAGTAGEMTNRSSGTTSIRNRSHR